MRGRQLRGRIAAVAVGAVAATVVAGCGSDDEGSSAAAPSTAPGVGVVTTAADGVQEITIQTQDDYDFTPDSFTVAPGKVRLTLLNAAEEMVHNLRFTPGEGPEPIEAEIDLLTPGSEITIDFEVTVPGDHEFVCTFHTQVGQVGTMTVQG
jgi:plastocyanin